jgi:hypothetical protein
MLLDPVTAGPKPWQHPQVRLALVARGSESVSYSHQTYPAATHAPDAAVRCCSFNVGANIDLEVGVPSVSSPVQIERQPYCCLQGGHLAAFSVRVVMIRCANMQRFWSSLTGKYGNKFYWQDNGQEAAIVNAVGAGFRGSSPQQQQLQRGPLLRCRQDAADLSVPWLTSPNRGHRVVQVSAIDSCIREPNGRGKCAKVRKGFGSFASFAFS